MTDRYFVVYVVAGYVHETRLTTTSSWRADAFSRALSAQGQDVYVQECRKEIGV